MIRALSITIIIFIVTTAQAQNLKLTVEEAFQDKQVLKFFNAIYSFDFQAAEETLEDIQNKGFVYHFMKANYHWWMHISEGESTIQSELCYENLEKSLEILKLEDNKLDASASHFGKLLTYATYSRIALKNLEYSKAVKYAVKISSEIGKSIEFAKSDDYNKLPTGIYLYAASWSLDHYPILYPILLFIPDGDKDLGINYLTQLNKSENILLKTESIYFLMKIYNEGEENPKSAKPYAEKLLELYPENLFFRAYYISLLKNLDLTSEAEQECITYLQILESNKNLNHNQLENLNQLIK